MSTADGIDTARTRAFEVGLVIDPDPALFGRALAAAALGVARNPVEGTEATVRAGIQLLRAGLAAVNRALGVSTPGPMPVDPKDRRFADPAWEDNAAYYTIRQLHLILRQYAFALAGAAKLDPVVAGKADMALGFLADAAAPTNFLPTNPAALKRMFESGGRSIVSGLRNFADDVLHNRGRPRQVDRTSFEVGRNMAATPSKVVYRNDLIELLQYLPQTDEVHQIPILCSPPWINKYYIMDLAPDRSFIEWAVRHGHSVFAISYRNPDKEMANSGLDDYLIGGLRTALDVVCEITGSDTAHVVGLCLGGAMTMMTAAHLAKAGDSRIGTITLLNTMVDFAEPGILGNFTDDAAVAKLEKKMARRGYLEGWEMAATFDMLRANDLIFKYTVSNWLMGESPPAFDLLAWNADCTRMPAAMHSFYLRSCYVENRLVSGDLKLAGHRLELADVKQPMYIVAAITDHIVPWRSSYATTQYVSGRVRFVLSNGGHIAGVVNPPSSKAWYLTAEDAAATPDAWYANTSTTAGSWWEDWAVWAGEHGGPMIDPPRLGSEVYEVLGDGPGDYVYT
ncbi:PHA/PHB synthase family protein [Mycolicibacter icosiumassiliensis]|uniref:PHA/PHB synthase family protein n=1 Tax=Mycolicibacter icosiumassiliensis TaxID=1792835 RepID=UPI00082C3455|nr:alpha/beta fold hydrolase [Mycolicibacter icosiumassiliensis]